jgi:hypothetical protein
MVLEAAKVFDVRNVVVVAIATTKIAMIDNVLALVYIVTSY